MLLASTEAFPRRSTADGLMKRNLANVLARDEAIDKRHPQGPSSNPGEAIKPGASNANNANSAPHGGDPANPNTNAEVIGSDSTGADGMSNGGAGGASDGFTPEMGGNGMSASGSASMTTSASMSSGSSKPSSMVSMVSSQRPDRPPYPGPEVGIYPPSPTGGSGAHAPRPTGHKEPSVGETLVETRIKEEGDNIITHEVLWQYNGTGWSMIGVPLPSGVISGIHLPPSTSTGGMTQGTGTPKDSGLEGVLLTPVDNGFTGPESPQSVWDILYSWIVSTGRGLKKLTAPTAMDGQSADVMLAGGESSDMMSAGGEDSDMMPAGGEGSDMMPANGEGSDIEGSASTGGSANGGASGTSPMDAQSSGTTPMDPSISGSGGQANAGNAGTGGQASEGSSDTTSTNGENAVAGGQANGGAGAGAGTAQQKKRGW